MKTVITFTSTLSSKLMDWLDRYVEKEGVTKRSVIETALKLYQAQQKKKKLALMFTELNQDEETFGLAEDGMSDYLEQLTEYDK